MNKMTKILGNQDNYVTKGLKKKELIRTRNNFPYQIQKCNKQQYQESFVQNVPEKNGKSIKERKKGPAEEINLERLVCKQCNKV